MPVTTEGVSPKAFLPALIGVAVGVALVVLGILVEDETLKTIGYSVLGTAVVAFPIAYKAGPGNVVPNPAAPIGQPSDAGLTEDQQKKIELG